MGPLPCNIVRMLMLYSAVQRGAFPQIDTTIGAVTSILVAGALTNIDTAATIRAGGVGILKARVLPHVFAAYTRPGAGMLEARAFPVPQAAVGAGAGVEQGTMGVPGLSSLPGCAGGSPLLVEARRSLVTVETLVTVEACCAPSRHHQAGRCSHWRPSPGAEGRLQLYLHWSF